MVSTRGVKLKFVEGERVLCYEPDPTKAKVLYDSKVLDVVINKDHRGRKNIEYLIHFQGWNSSWDRCVSEEYVLKDTPENRQLQKDLAEKSQLQLGAYLYRKERKSKKGNDKANVSSEDGSCGSPVVMEEEDGVRNTSSSDGYSSGDDEIVVLNLPSDLKVRLEHDYFLIHTKNKLHKFPASPNVVHILECYWRHYVSNQISCLNEKQPKYRPYSNFTKMSPEDVQRNINLCREVLDGIRIYFDFTVQDLLLYGSEKGQVQTLQANFLPLKLSMKDENQMKNDVADEDPGQSPKIDDYHENDNKAKSKRCLRNRTVETNGNGESSTGRESQNSLSGDEKTKLPVWRALPEHIYNQYPPPPCLVFGVVHLTRLFVKLPELLNSTNMPEEKVKVLLTRLEQFFEFLIDHKEWYESTSYVDAPKQEIQ